MVECGLVLRAILTVRGCRLFMAVRIERGCELIHVIKGLTPLVIPAE